jgi:hypothetical protein
MTFKQHFSYLADKLAKRSQSRLAEIPITVTLAFISAGRAAVSLLISNSPNVSIKKGRH